MKKIIINAGFLFLMIGFPLHGKAQQKIAWQDKNTDLLQFSGVVVEGDSLRPVPYTSIIIKGSYRGTISDYFGYFSFVAHLGDTIEFSAIGYTPASFIIPDTLSINKYSLIQVLTTDTISLKMTEVFPWPSKEQFKAAFLALQLPADDIVKAEKNLQPGDMRQRMTGMAVEAGLNYKYTQQQYQSKLYYAGQLPPNNLLNPIAWAKFIHAWKSGDFKKKKK